jgi:hypothetical protein
VSVELRRPLPGVAFKVEPPLRVSLPRMDVTAFVGFAEKGPLHVPVVIEDPTQYAAIFGGAPRLAYDPQSGLWQHACLPRAVAEFFAQGGRRCWVIRTADGAVVNRFPLSGMLHGTGGDFAPVIARARSAGSWSDALRAGVSLLTEPLGYAVDEIAGADQFAGPFQVLRGAALRVGDLIQLDCEDEFRAYVAVRTVADVATPAGKTGRWQQVTGEQFLFAQRSRDLRGKLRVFDGETVRAVYNAKYLQPDLEHYLEVHFTPLPQFTPGEWLKFTSNSGQNVWLQVENSGARGVEIRTGWRHVKNRMTPLRVTRATRLTLALEAREGGELRGMIRDLGLLPSHPRFFGNLPDDETLYFSQMRPRVPSDPSSDSPLFAEAAAPRFPLAADQPLASDSVFIPLAVEAAPPFYTAPLFPSSLLPLQRDGLVPPTADPLTLTWAQWSVFFESLFLDARLKWVNQGSLLAETFDILHLTEYASEADRRANRLKGLHAVLPLDEVSVIALPDAAQRGWRVVEELAPPPPPPEPPPPPPEAECAGHELFQPELAPEPEPEPEPPPLPELDIAPPERLVARWMLLDALEYATEALALVQQRAVEICAARADAVAILSLPQHFRARESLEYTADLRRTLAQSGQHTDSYAALYHPWLMFRGEDGRLLAATPDGAVCGVIASHAINRGAWIAPANQILRRALALTPPLEANRLQELYNERINLILQAARGFTLMSASTLAGSYDLEPLNVRRLLILLRRLVLRDGQNYVFAPHSPAFRQQIARTMERQLEALFVRGAFAGRDPAQSYQVVVDETLNTRQTVESGQLIVELRVAPSQPMTFILVRLIQTEAGTLVVQEL